MRTDRLNRGAALELLERVPQIELMAQAHSLRKSFHPRDEVTFVVDTNPNYTNACVTKCTFCSFYRPPGHPESYRLTPEQVGAKAAHAQAQGATTILLQGGHDPRLPLAYYLELISAIQDAAPGMHLHLFSPAEIDQIARGSSLSRGDVLRIFYDAGLRTMPGGGAEILVERVRRRISPKKIGAVQWLDIMRAAHETGFKTSATMTYGHIESPRDIVAHLFRLRELQDETGGFYAFIPWSFKPGTSPLSRLRPDPELPSSYVRIIALARLVLDNFPHIQASWFGEGWRAGQLALHAGADDFGGVLLEENVLLQAQHAAATRVSAIVQMIREAGFTPVQRTTGYDHIAFPDSPGQHSPLPFEYKRCDASQPPNLAAVM